MKASYNWIRELVPGLHASPDEVAEGLTSAGLEVEGQAVFGGGLETCLVVAVSGVRPHPSRSSLQLVAVDAGAFGTKEVVCGAPNVPAPGGLVILAPLGTHLPAKGMTIEARAIGGITSEGMLCSESELGIGEGSGGILVLPPASAAPGTPLLEALPYLRDTIYEINLTPNRPDGLGHIGLAREVAAVFSIHWAVPTPAKIAREKEGAVGDVVTVTIEDGEGCPHYGAALVEGVTISPSPLWVRTRLHSLGVRPISNVVDVTNLVMLESGHPLHAFDLATVKGPAIVVRRAKDGETMRTLDGLDRTLSTDDLLICDAERPVGMAGIMGGENTEIRPTTERVLLECAYFSPTRVRRSARRHGIHSEASHRFERGVDWGDTARTLAQAVARVVEFAGGTALKGRVVIEKRSLERPSVSVRSSRVGKLLGAPVALAEMASILEKLGFEITSRDDDTLVTRVPSHRPDVAREVDLIEEVAHMRGLDAIHPVLPAMRPAARPATSRLAATREDILRKARAAAVELGLSEALIYGFVARRSLEILKAPSPSVEIVNPLTEAQAVMRTSLLPGLLAAVDSAQRHGERDIRLFAAGALFLANRAASSDLPDERLAFSAVIAGDRPTYLGKPEPVDVWEAKGLALGFIERLLRRSASVEAIEEKSRPPHLHPRGAAKVVLDGRTVGCLGPIHPDTAEAFGYAPGVMVVELDLEALAAMTVRVPQYQPIPRFPASRRDVALVVRDEVAAGEVAQAVREAAGPLAEEVALFDRFVGGSIPAGFASLAYRIVYRAADRTLTDAEVDAAHAAVVQAVGNRFGAQLRA